MASGLAALIVAAQVTASVPATVTGRVLQADASAPLPGVTVTLDGPLKPRPAVTREDGTFSVADLPPGSYGVTFTLVGFVEVHREVAVGAGEHLRLDVALPVAALGEPDLVMTPPSELIADATAIAHLRIERTAPPAACGAAATGALHRAAVLAVARGRLGPTVGYWQGSVGYCRTAAGQVIAPDALLVPGDELLVLLGGSPPSYSSLAGSLTELRVVDGRIDRDFGPVREGMTVAEALAALRR